MLLRLLRRCHVAAAADRRQKDAAECGAEQAVDYEIARRVDDNEHVAQLGVVEMKAAAFALGWLEQCPEDLVEEGWSLTDDEDRDDDDDTQCDVVVHSHSVMSSCTVTV